MNPWKWVAMPVALVWALVLVIASMPYIALSLAFAFVGEDGRADRVHAAMPLAMWEDFLARKGYRV